MSLTIRVPASADESRWRELFAAYNTFYRAEVPGPIVAVTWQRILDPESPVNALVAELDGEVVGITNYLYHLSTWEERPSCYLEDLYVDRAARGAGAARALIEGQVRIGNPTMWERSGCPNSEVRCNGLLTFDLNMIPCDLGDTRVGVQINVEIPHRAHKDCTRAFADAGDLRTGLNDMH